jgi:hypothetical protein
MTREAVSIDISTMPDLARVAEEVASTRTPRILTRGDKEIAVVFPASPRRRRRAKPVTDADIEAALAASWVGLVEPDALKRELDDARSDDRPPVRL